MSRFCIVHQSTVLTVYRPGDTSPWFQIEAANCGGKKDDERQTNLLEAANLLRIALADPAGPGCDYLTPETKKKIP